MVSILGHALDDLAPLALFWKIRDDLYSQNFPVCGMRSWVLLFPLCRTYELVIYRDDHNSYKNMFACKSKPHTGYKINMNLLVNSQTVCLHALRVL